MRFFIPAIAASFLLAAPAWADAIDGEWCSEVGQQMEIQGPTITIPSGTTLKGNYDRHAFSYQIPAGETDAGATVSMVLLSEDTMHLKHGQDAPVEVWHRCKFLGA
ncbi:MAG: hypothetical protein AAFY56_14905 [Pseudomonadota bacterium]